MMNKRLFCILLLVPTVWLAYSQTCDYIPLQKQVLYKFMNKLAIY